MSTFWAGGVPEGIRRLLTRHIAYHPVGTTGDHGDPEHGDDRDYNKVVTTARHSSSLPAPAHGETPPVGPAGTSRTLVDPWHDQ